VKVHSHSETESPIICDIEMGVPEIDPTCVLDECLTSIVENWSTLPEHIKLAIQALVKAGSV